MFIRDPLGRLVPAGPGLPVARGNQGGMGRRLDEAGTMATLPDADIAGAIGPGVVPGGEQAVGARRAKVEAEDMPPPAATFRPLGGAQQNNRGNIKIVTVGDGLFGSSFTVTAASVVETSKNSGDDAEALTVQLALEMPNEVTDIAGSAAAMPLEIVCVLEWGVGGAFFTAECDWNQGVAFSVVASFLRVSARVTYTSVGSGPLDVVLKASIGYGNANSLNVSSPARRTIRLGNIAAGADSTLLAIPAWAVGVTLVDGSFNQPNCRVILQRDNTGLTPEAVYLWTDRTNNGAQVEGQFPIPAQSRFVRVTNLLGVATQSSKLVFNLGF